jgi:hypothetical protein
MGLDAHKKYSGSQKYFRACSPQALACAGQNPRLSESNFETCSIFFYPVPQACPGNPIGVQSSARRLVCHRFYETPALEGISLSQKNREENDGNRLRGFDFLLTAAS